MVIIKARKFAVLPLISFYIYSFILIIYRIYAIIWFLPVVFNVRLLSLFFPPTLKAIIGFGQVWINIELSIIISLAI